MRREMLDAVSNPRKASTANIAPTLLEAQRIGALLIPRENILSSLRYPEMRNRWDTITKANPSTYEWMFDAKGQDLPPLKFSKWLSREEGIFWITGKAGSGKSTLVKHISEDLRTRMALETWARGRELCIASHYFWFLGSPMEKSYEGLLRSILYEVLVKTQELIPTVCHTRWSDEMNGRDTAVMAWSSTELLQSVARLAEQNVHNRGREACFCFFIDGLDEYDDDHRRVTATLLELTKNTHIKICASSRPWNVFHDAFETSKSQDNWMELHLFTKGDIATVVNQEIGHVLARRFSDAGDCQQLVAEVVEKSQGVFLWVALVIRKELLPCLENREDLNFLRKRLTTVPSGSALQLAFRKHMFRLT